MKAYRDLHRDGAHSVCLDTGVLLRFDEGGVLRDPTEAEEASMTRDAMRRQRFEAITEGEAPLPSAAGAATVDDGQGERGRRRRRHQPSPEPAAEASPVQESVDERSDGAATAEPAAEGNRDDE